VTLEILDTRGEVVRRFSSTDKPEVVNPKDFNVPMYWVRPARTVSTAAGLHRFVWDLTYPTPDVLSRDYPISAIAHDTPLYPQGAATLPGKYTVKLIAEGRTVTQPLEIRMDPRVKTSPEDLRRQFDLDRKVADDLHRDFEALQQVRSLRAQLKPLASKSADVARMASEMDAKAAAIAGGEGGYGARFLSNPEGRSLARLNAGFASIISALDSADAAPTTQELATVAELEKALAEQLAAWNEIKTKDLPNLNEQFKKAGLPVVDLQKSIPVGADSGETQDRD
jgi:hypothetical protein